MLAALMNRYTFIALGILAALLYTAYLHWRISTLETFETKTELLARAQVEQNRVESASRQSITNQVAADYEKRLSVIAARVSRLQSPTNSRPGPVPAVPQSTPGPSPAAPDSSVEISTCGADYARAATQLEELQQWVIQQENVPRSTLSRTPITP